MESIEEESGRTTLFVYSNRDVEITEKGISSTKKYDTYGYLTEVIYPAGTITYNLRPDGQPKSIIAPGNVTTSFKYDKYGRREEIGDPSAGKQTWTYDNDGNIHSVTDANNQTISYYYDNYNRISDVIRPEFTTFYAYCPTDGLLQGIVSSNGTSTDYWYDEFGRLEIETDFIEQNKYLEKSYSYLDGNVESLNYSNHDGNIVTENYTYQNGHLLEVKLNNNTSIWKLTGVNAFGQPTSVSTGGMTRTYAYNSFGTPIGRTAGASLNHTYNFNEETGNLNFRKDNKYNIQEDFDYDHLNRLKEYAGQSADYDLKGNITKKTDIGTSFQYNVAGKPYAISRVVNHTNAISERSQTITYTSFKRPATISEGDNSASFTYNGNGDRVKMDLSIKLANFPIYLQYTHTYISDCYESEGLSNNPLGPDKQKLYLGGNFYSAPAVYVKEQFDDWQLYYISRDYLGSITHVTHESGTFQQQLSYDAWGRLRNVINHTVYSAENQPNLFLGRGYTGHEHLPWFGLINMNARLYDPAVGRFLSPDPYVPDGTFSQDFNRYSYARNNPMVYTDPDGEFVWLVGAAIGGIINWIANGAQFSWQGLGYFGVGAAAGAVGGIAGQAITSTFGSLGFIAGAASGSVGGAAAGLVSGAGNAWVSGMDSEDGFFLGLQGAYFGAISGGLIGGFSGGINALKYGGDFWTGEGASFDFVLSSCSSKPTIEVGENMEYSNEYAKYFSDEYFGKDIKNLDNLYADGTIPNGYKKRGDLVYNKKWEQLGGSAIYNGIGKGSNVYLYKTAFTSMENLYLMMGHEYIHVYFNANGYYYALSSQEVAAYQWMIDQATIWKLSTKGFEASQAMYYKSGIKPSLNYKQAGFFLLNIRPW